MSSIGGFNSGYTSPLFSNLGGIDATASLGNMLSDYASIQNGSYGKLLKAYYAKQKTDEAAEKKGTTDATVSRKLSLVKSDAEAMQKAVSTLTATGENSLFQLKDVTKVDQETGKKTTTQEYDKDKILGAVKRFAETYNGLLDSIDSVDDTSVLRKGVMMVQQVEANEKMLASAGITIGKGNKLEIDEKKFKEADNSTLKVLFEGSQSVIGQVGSKASQISGLAGNASNKAQSAFYSTKGGYLASLNAKYSYCNYT